MISQLTNAIGIYIASLECPNTKYPEWPAANDLFIEYILLNYNQKPKLGIVIRRA